ncbi:MAG: tRNA (cytidine(32)/uridine(32)-2'-O)-methyltransferase (EC [uncultured Paraburkholderia sp.]|nr:MAG: tRNA (cytidine(32)/uridine(32)-2'-O)-methyltransferase (EC [uncultured Paraburkholderia sp.]
MCVKPRAVRRLRALALPYAFSDLQSFSVDHTHHSSDPAVAELRGGFTSTRFVLVEPSYPGNVGAAARALKTMGFSRLVLVSPRVPHVQSDPEAIAMASGADDVLASAHIVPTLTDALSGVHWSIALTARQREYGPPQWTPRAAASLARDEALHGEIALVFGNERTGLSNEDVERCSALAHIPANPAYSSLNLAQAVQILAYELRMIYLTSGAEANAPANPAPQAAASAEPSGPRAASDEIESMFSHLERARRARISRPRESEEADVALAPALRAFGARARGGEHRARHRQAHLAEDWPQGRRGITARTTGRIPAHNRA